MLSSELLTVDGEWRVSGAGGVGGIVEKGGCPGKVSS